MTRKQYLDGGDHHEYYSQFITEATRRFVSTFIGVEKVKAALAGGDKNLNELYPMHSNGWIWDQAPVNVSLARELGEDLSLSTKTCVGKACARAMAWGEF